MTQLIDLSHSIGVGTVTYPGLPAPEITDHLTREQSEHTYGPNTTFHIGRITMVTNTGTYLDSPFHRYQGRDDVSDVPLAAIANLAGVRVRVGGSRQIGPDMLRGRQLSGRAVLFETGWSRHWGTPSYGVGAPFVNRAAAEYLMKHGVRLVGIDSVNIDDMDDRTRPAHSLLLDADIPIVEHMRALDQLPDDGFRFFAVPPRFRGLGTFPVRAFAIVD